MIITKNFDLTVITPTIGRVPHLENLIQSIRNQKTNYRIFHILLWDENIVKNSLKAPFQYNSDSTYSIVLPWGLGKNGNAPGSSLRAVGMVSAFTPFVTFADDDVYWDDNHVENMMELVKDRKNWAFCRRKVYSPFGNEYLGIDNFESVGDSSDRKVPYIMCDGNTMIFRREFGVIASQFYRETKERNDDRLMYKFLTEYGGPPGITKDATINQICPDFLIDFFKENCTKC